MMNLPDMKSQTDNLNAETKAALSETEKMMADPNAPKYSVEEALKKLKT